MFIVPHQLIEKYAISAPRYTSYPTAVEFNDGVNSSIWHDAINKDLHHLPKLYPSPIKHSLSLYLHIPFCFQPCYFCACHKIIPQSRKVLAPYLKALEKELCLYSKVWPQNINVEQIHWGGGTPDYLTPEETLWLSQICKKYFPNITKDIDFSVEVDPRTTSNEHIDAYIESGFNRLSLGVQDFNPEVQKCINRIQSVETTSNLVEYSRKKNISSVNIDLLYGLPKQTISTFEETLEQTITIRPDRIALYGYAHVTWVKKAQKVLEKAKLPSPQEKISLFLLALNKLCNAGYIYIGMDHFALPSDFLAKALKKKTLNRNFMGYTNHKGARILGIGASSISSLPSGYAQNEKDISSYIESLEAKSLPITRGVLRTRDDCLRAEIIEQILCHGFLNIKKIEKTWEINFWNYFNGVVAPLEILSKDQLIEFDNSELRLSNIGRVLSRNIAMVFDAYLPKHKALKKQKFSQAI